MISLNIAGVLFGITGRDCTLLHDLGPAYGTFAGDEKAAAPDISVNVFVGNLPDLSDAKSIFSSESAWFLCYHDENHYLVLEPPAVDSGPLWVAKFNPPFEEVTIFCSRQLADHKDGDCVLPNPVRYPLDQILLMHYLAGRGGTIVHAAGIVINDKGYIFPGRSGAGKSTLSRLFRASPSVRLLSDDRVVVRQTGGEIFVYGTPWPGEEGIAENAGVPLAGIFFLSHGEDNAIRDLTGHGVLERLMPVISVPWFDRELTGGMLLFCDLLISGVRSYELSFRPDREVVDAIERHVSCQGR